MKNPALKSLFRALVGAPAAKLPVGFEQVQTVAAPRELDRNALRAVSGGAINIELPKRGWRN